MSDVLTWLHRVGVVPVVVLDDAERAIPLAHALLDAGLYCVEVTLRTPAGLPALSAISAVTDLTVGAGTVLDPAMVKASHDAGATFIVSPGYDQAIVDACTERRILALPGVATATELQTARRAGLRAVKFFPAETAGGLPALKALAAPFPDMRFMPTGGIGTDNVADYLRFDSVLAVGGSWMVPRDVIAAGDFARIQTLARRTSELVSHIRQESTATR
jgi:2-dehydro-3-deoxyphosphogluconate aldolase/(4S)-4-hydroxy-2-oxoglutarate aldolase